jgi:hypothetical protein
MSIFMGAAPYAGYEIVGPALGQQPGLTGSGRSPCHFGRLYEKRVVLCWVPRFAVTAAGTQRKGRRQKPTPSAGTARYDLEADPNTATPIAASRACIAPAISVAFPLPVVIVDMEADIGRIGEPVFGLPAVPFVITDDRGGRGRAGQGEKANNGRTNEILFHGFLLTDFALVEERFRWRFGSVQVAGGNA